MSTNATVISRYTEVMLRAMGSDAHVIVVDGDADLIPHALDRIEQLESRWSRFRADSDISRLNRQPGTCVDVTDDTALMVSRAIELWRTTGCRVDPLVLRAVVEAGYDRSFEDIVVHGTRPQPRSTPWQPIACPDIVVDLEASTVCLPAGSSFDPGGIGKGLAADLVVDELLARGAQGACVNLGGDLRVAGRAPQEGGWLVAIDHPWADDTLLTVRVGNGAVATSSVLRRTWSVGRSRWHHLIDPATGQPSTTDLVQASVVAAHAWVAEGLAKAILLGGSEHPFDLLPDGIEAVAVHRDGRVFTTPGLSRFVVEAVVPQRLDVPDTPCPDSTDDPNTDPKEDRP